MTNLTFDSNDLQTASIITQQVDHYNAPSKSASIFPLAHANKSSIPFVNYPNRKIVASGHLTSDTIANLDALIDTFKGYFNTESGNLDIDYNGGTRRFIATVTNIVINRPKGLTYAEFSVEFTCVEPFGRATSTNSLLSATGRTSASYDDSITVLGTAKWQLPIITITINSVTDGDGHITVKNNANDQGITIIGQTFEADDVIEISCINRTVKLNGTEIDFIGSFPEFQTGSQEIGYSDGFSARNFDIDVDQYAYYL